ncbi:MAG TPA: biotin carboxylase N-terminal domain-containing protein [Steroidobacteraceae bacterium]|jgi:3-methylcrotonyl-CoA carboxylase alpha subunit|nr:biotin carboxylase N-terminal domain-containing protein [Steroidobacteraceae bacterium]
MSGTLLVANRGEIACRIFRTAGRLGWRTVAVFSDADAGARHTREADEAVWLGPAPARDSYLNIERVLGAARASGATAIHPGYGFLSENAQFAQACADAGLAFIGPPAAAIAAMGSKIVAKNRMREAGVPVLPGYAGPEQDLKQLAAAAHTVGLPLIIKPALGGGGKGMQIVRQESELTAALAAARRLAESGFGDGALLLERYLAAPRHLEVQVFGDGHGNFVHLGDRDCSIQRRHQKLIEEAPAPAVPDALRARLRAAALVVAREIGYVSAGTVEFLYDGREFYFMEMNTRLQVEHTVTEAITGLDLVEWQLRIATGEPLPLTQEQIRLNGHAIEARVCAEDPERGFLPSAGRLRLMEWAALESVRVDAGFTSGDTVPDCYDSLLGKVIAWAPQRTLAASRLAAALTCTYAAGVHTNERWLARILRSKRFLEVRHNIALLDKGTAEFAPPATLSPETLILAALAAHAAQPQAGAPQAGSPWAVCDGFTPNLPATVAYSFSRHGETHSVELRFVGGRPAAAQVDGRTLLEIADLVCRPDAEGTASIAARLVERRRHARCLLEGARITLWEEDAQYEFLIEDPRRREFSASASGGGLTTPLPGVVVSVPVAVGQKVAAGEVLMVIEAMKMEHTISAPYAGTVKAIHFARGDRVPEASQLLELARAAEA